MEAKLTRQGGRPVDLKKRVEMTATATHPAIKAGAFFTVHQEQTAKLIAQGWAVEGHVKLEKSAPAATSTDTGAEKGAKK
jgi:hypothetical protein